MLTARATLDDKAAGFGEGADDYLVKPFELRELDLRLHALTRRARAGETQRRLKVADLVFDLDTFAVKRAGQPLTLPALPLKILELLMKRAPGVVLRRDIEQAVWGDSPPDSDSLRVRMYTLRGIGYRLKAPDAPAA